jgi:predicted nuclease with RNAse H fold/dephospho-CoA kinase
VGVLLDGRYSSWLAGDDAEELNRLLEPAKCVVTFNGSAFDIPFLKSTFPEIRLPGEHIDLRFAVRRVGLRGGQKAIERVLGLARSSDLADLGGAEAVLLWHRYLRGDIGALRHLISYNRADVDGMRRILDHLIDALALAEEWIFPPPRFQSLPIQELGWANPTSDLPHPSTRGFERLSFEDVLGSTGADRATLVGLDLTGSAKKPSGFCIMKGRRVETTRLATDDEIISAILQVKPALVAIDSPLCLPAGRASVSDDDPGRAKFGIVRECERTLKRRGVNVYPCLLPSMQQLTARGIRLAGRLRSFGVPVIECYPGAAQDIVGIPRKGAGQDFLATGLKEFGFDGAFSEGRVSHDELDAITCAMVGGFFLAGQYEALDNDDGEPLIVPSRQTAKQPTIVGVSGRIAAGKTTFCRVLEDQGFAYVRYSQVVDEVLAERGLPLNRKTRQTVGEELHKTKGQRWLGRRLLRRLSGRDYCVIDGLRFPEDYAFWFEQAGSKFVHVHIDAPVEMRQIRYTSSAGEAEFTEADAQPVESQIAQLRALDAIMIDNSGSLDQLSRRASQIAAEVSLRRRPRA